MQSLRVSVVVPTYQRPDLLARCLDALLVQDLDQSAYEVIVCDDAPDARTEALVHRCKVCHPGHTLRYLAIEDTQGPAAARNAGWRAAQSAIIAFTDDDTVPDRGWLSKGLAALQSGTHAVAGRILMPLPDIPSDYERDASHLTHAEFATANVMILKAALHAVGGFDERYALAWREDSDLQFSLLDAGMTIRSAPEAIVVHPLRPAKFGAAIRAQRKVMFDTLLYKKHPGRYRERIRSGLPWGYLTISGSLIFMLAATAMHARTVAVCSGVLWIVLTVAFCLKRLKGTRHDVIHVLEMVLTSIAIPPVSIAWRVVGSIRFGKGFP